jgi:hypothetical protein
VRIFGDFYVQQQCKQGCYMGVGIVMLKKREKSEYLNLGNPDLEQNIKNMKEEDN